MRLVLPIIVAIALAVYAVIDCLQTDPAEIRGPRRPVWVVVILLLPVVGPLAWLIARRGGPRAFPSRRRRRPTPPVAPDDNPEFLRQLRNIDEEHERMLSEWEAELRRREEDLRNNRGDDGDDIPRS
ncbi:MAG TPA: PLDc N-terminal domain-containing protein [Jiangellaceae bacterium]|nr:PLDc N-terminal domain-containing protein [Jiangellaceae bacterium]